MLCCQDPLSFRLIIESIVFLAILVAIQPTAWMTYHAPKDGEC